jgi:transcriptional regulator with XRE-family HTH domain
MATTAAAAAQLRVLRDELFAQGYSQREFSGVCGVPEVRLSAIIRGRAHATIDEMTAIAHTLKKSRAYLFGEQAVAQARVRALLRRAVS